MENNRQNQTWLDYLEQKLAPRYNVSPTSKVLLPVLLYEFLSDTYGHFEDGITNNKSGLIEQKTAENPIYLRNWKACKLSNFVGSPVAILLDEYDSTTGYFYSRLEFYDASMYPKNEKTFRTFIAGTKPGAYFSLAGSYDPQGRYVKTKNKKELFKFIPGVSVDMDLDETFVPLLTEVFTIITMYNEKPDMLNAFLGGKWRIFFPE